MLLQFVVALLLCITISSFAIAAAQELIVTTKLLQQIGKIKIETNDRQERLNGLRQLCQILKCPDGKVEEWQKYLLKSLVKIHPDKAKVPELNKSELIDLATRASRVITFYKERCNRLLKFEAGQQTTARLDRSYSSASSFRSFGSRRTHATDQEDVYNHRKSYDASSSSFQKTDMSTKKATTGPDLRRNYSTRSSTKSTYDAGSTSSSAKPNKATPSSRVNLKRSQSTAVRPDTSSNNFSTGRGPMNQESIRKILNYEKVLTDKEKYAEATANIPIFIETVYRGKNEREKMLALFELMKQEVQFVREVLMKEKLKQDFNAIKKGAVAKDIDATEVALLTLMANIHEQIRREFDKNKFPVEEIEKITVEKINALLEKCHQIDTIRRKKAENTQAQEQYTSKKSKMSGLSKIFGGNSKIKKKLGNLTDELKSMEQKEQQLFREIKSAAETTQFNLRNLILPCTKKLFDQIKTLSITITLKKNASTRKY